MTNDAEKQKPDGWIKKILDMLATLIVGLNIIPLILLEAVSKRPSGEAHEEEKKG